MANLIEYIQSQIYENSTEDISGSIMQQVLTRMASDEGVVNVHTITGQTPFADYNNAQAARDAVPAGFKKLGLIITYKLSSGWYIDEFIGSATSGWSTASNWKCLGPISVSQNAETGKTTITIGSQSFDVATQPVSVSQNRLTIGNAPTPITDSYAINVNELTNSDSAFTTNVLARIAVPSDLRANGLIITYRLSAGWYTEQYIADTVNDSQWQYSENWKAYALKEDVEGVDGKIDMIDKTLADDETSEVQIAREDGEAVSRINVNEDSTLEESIEIQNDKGRTVGNITVGEPHTTDEEQIWESDNGSEVYAKVNKNGMFAKKFTELSISTKTIDFEGDSLTKANDDSYLGFCRAAISLGMEYVNNGVSGATVSVYGSPRISIYELVTSRTQSFDYTLIQLSTVNDNNYSSRKGALTSQGTYYEENAEINYDVETYYGALEALARYCILHLNKVGWILPYRIGISMGDSNVDKADCIRNVAKKWGIPLLDLNNDSGFNLCNDEMAARYGAYTGNVPEYDENLGYAQDEQVRHNNKTYKAISAISAPAGAFDESEWTEISETNYDKCHCNTDGYLLMENKIVEFIKSL